jgi:hypothetical protein
MRRALLKCLGWSMRHLIGAKQAADSDLCLFTASRAAAGSPRQKCPWEPPVPFLCCQDPCCCCWLKLAKTEVGV